MKKRITFSVLALLILLNPLHSLLAQNAGINSTGAVPLGDAILDLNSGNLWNNTNGQGVLLPNLTSIQISGITAPYAGVAVYNTTCNVIDYWNGSAWVPVTPTLATPGPIAGDLSPCPAATGETYSVPAVAGATTYTWTVPTGATITNGQTTDAITVTFGATAGNVCVTAGNLCGTSSPYCTTIYFRTDTAWVQMTPTGGPPSARQSMCTVWDNVNNEMLMYSGAGGLGAPTYDNDLWSYSPSTNTWTAITPIGGPPTAHYLSYVAWDPADDEMIVFGGGQALTNNLWVYKPIPNTWTSLSPASPPGAREQGSTVWDAADNLMLICGGYNGSRLNELWSYAPTTDIWTHLTPLGGPPGVRDGNSAVWDAVNSQMIMFGGYNGSGGFYNDLWSYKPSTNTWAPLTPTGTLPAARENQAFVLDPITNVIYLYGGDFSSTYLNDLWAYSISANTWTEINNACSPPATVRTCAGIVWDASNSKIYVFGGCTTTLELNDLWQYTP